MGRGKILDRVAKKSLTEKVAFEKKKKKPKGSKEARHANIWEKSIPGGAEILSAKA